jgi:hypothetical protein
MTEAIVGQELALDCLLAGASWGALVGRVGDNTLLVVGFELRLTAQTAGELFLDVNDCCNLKDSSGEFDVIISSP